MKARIGLGMMGCLLLASLIGGQEATLPKAGTARFGDPTATGRNLQNYIYGVVKNISKNELVLDKTAFGNDQSFKLMPKTKYVRDGKPTKLEDFKAGDKVFVQ